MPTFFVFPDSTAIAEADIKSERTRALLRALERDQDVSVIELARVERDGRTHEIIIVDIACDGVPTKNRVGIAYVERVAIEILDRNDVVPRVYALRKHFPRIPHRHSTGRDKPVLLCLYFESDAATLRTWTPASFVRRIRWWFETSAKEDGSKIDQPIEQPFFESPFELMLPWNFKDLLNKSADLALASTYERPAGRTMRLILRASHSPEDSRVVLVPLVAEPSVGNTVDADPMTLGELDALLSERGINFLSALKLAIKKLVNPQGARLSPTETHTIILTTFPLQSSASGVAETVSHCAFFLTNDPLDLGVATGALFTHGGKFFDAVGVLDSPHSDQWRSIAIAPLTIVHELTPSSARSYSGIQASGPKAVAIGAGALGSGLLNIWGRQGWGQWCVIDHDHIRPHNIARHTATNVQVGQSKSEAVAQLHKEIMNGASEIAPVTANALLFETEDVSAAFLASALVVDASADVGYPRASADRDDLPRHASTFLTPSGNACVILTEDAMRQHRLRTLEAQYLRAILTSNWGADHLAPAAGNFWSGGSCRDLSSTMPYSRVMQHCGTIAEYLPRLTDTDVASIRVWQTEPETGSLISHIVPVRDERLVKTSDWRIFFDDGVVEYLRALRAEALPNETGGVLLGFHDFMLRQTVIVSALPAPIDSASSPESFQRGQDGLSDAVRHVAARTLNQVQYVGEWHSHPTGSAASMSGDDVIQLIYLGLNMADDDQPALQMIVTDDDVSVSLCKTLM